MTPDPWAVPATPQNGTPTPRPATPPPAARTAPTPEAPEPETPLPGSTWTPREESAVDLERALLGCLLIASTTEPITTALDAGIDATTWQVARHELAWRQITRLAADGITPDVLLVADALHGTGDARAYGGRPEEYLADCVTLAPSHWSTGHYADKVVAHAARRARLDLPRRLTDLADDPHRYDQTLEGWLTDRHLERTGTVHTPNVHDLITSDDPEYDWLVPGMLERRDRVILTAAEGAGKSTWMRQTAVQLAAGIHPLNGNPIPPCRVLVVDVENSERQNRREYKPLVARAHLTAQVIDDPDGFHDRLRIVHRATLNLSDTDDVTWLEHAIRDARPDVLVTGPIYKLAAGDPNDEKEAKPIVLTLDRIRADHDLALLLEAHSKKAEGSDPRKRSKEPFGWSGWLRWPEFGLHLSDEGDVSHWRGQRDAGRQWPSTYVRGAHWPAWPWSVETDPHASHVARMKGICEELGRVPGTRELGERMGLNHSYIARIQAREGMAWGAFKARFEDA